MQADEDVGKIAMAVPVLVFCLNEQWVQAKALELFLQDLCDRTYDITLRRGAKTVNSLHLKHCVQSYNVYDFLREVVSKVPDYGHSEAGGDERSMVKRKKASADEMNESDDELKKNRMADIQAAVEVAVGEAEVGVEEEAVAEVEYLQNEILPPTEPESVHHSSKPTTDIHSESIKSQTAVEDIVPSRDFDLNAGLDENIDKVSAAASDGAAPPQQPPQPAAVAEPSEVANNEYPGWSVSEIDRMAIDPHLAHANSRLDEEDEDYDEE
ncbi:putative DNA-directed DNA polymerase transcription factor Hap3/NF-YB family [Helianthus debilis subsp. tardiflorus]